MKKLAAYTLIELMIAISIVSVLVGVGYSSYTKANNRQIGASAGEQLMGILTASQQTSSVGKKDCDGRYLGLDIHMISGSGFVTTQAQCEGGSGSVITTTIPGISFSSSYTFTFMPLSTGISMGDNSSLTINFTNGTGTIYSLVVTNTGTFEFQGTNP